MNAMNGKTPSTKCLENVVDVDKFSKASKAGTENWGRAISKRGASLKRQGGLSKRGRGVHAEVSRIRQPPRAATPPGDGGPTRRSQRRLRRCKPGRSQASEPRWVLPYPGLVVGALASDERRRGEEGGEDSWSLGNL